MVCEGEKSVKVTWAMGMCEGEGMVCEGDVMGVKVKVCRMMEKERCVMVRIGR